MFSRSASVQLLTRAVLWFGRERIQLQATFWSGFFLWKVPQVLLKEFEFRTPSSRKSLIAEDIWFYLTKFQFYHRAEFKSIMWARCLYLYCCHALKELQWCAFSAHSSLLIRRQGNTLDMQSVISVSSEKTQWK